MTEKQTATTTKNTGLAAKIEAEVPLHLLPTLNWKQRKFVVNWTGDPRASLQAAGYKVKTPHQVAVRMQRLMGKPTIRLLIESINRVLDGAAIASVAEIRSYWTAIMRDPEADTAHRIACSKLLGQGYGLLSERLLIEKRSISHETREYIFKGPESNFLKSINSPDRPATDLLPLEGIDELL